MQAQNCLFLCHLQMKRLENARVNIRFSCHLPEMWITERQRKSWQQWGRKRTGSGQKNRESLEEGGWERDVLGQNMLISNQHHTRLFLGISHCSILGQGPLSSCGPAERLQRPDAIRSGNKRSQSLVNVNDLPYIWLDAEQRKEICL